MSGYKKIILSAVAMLMISAFVCQSGFTQNITANENWITVKGERKTQSDGELFILKTQGTLTTVAATTASRIDWIILNSSDTVAQSITLYDSKTISSATAGVIVGAFKAVPSHIGFDSANTTWRTIQPGSIKFDFSSSPIPFSNGIVVLSTDTVAVTAIIKYHKLGGK